MPERILVVEDDLEICYLLEQVLSGSDREVVIAHNAAGARKALGEEEVALLILDLLLPDADGRQFLRELRSVPATATLPVVVVTSRGGPAVRSECFELGADAFIEKPFDPDVLAADIKVRLQRTEAWRNDALTDPLTGLLSAAGFVGHMEAQGADAGVVVFELDGLSALSDRFGWATAEMSIALIGAGLHKSAPELILARLGGGEFGVLSPAGDRRAPIEVAEDIVTRVRMVPLTTPDRETFRLTVSAGAPPRGTGQSATQRLETARGLVQRAQHAGGNRAVAGAAESKAQEEPGLVLIAEDDEIAAKILRHRLEREGFKVVRYNNGTDAYKGALETLPALVILDVRMPGMDGFEVLERLRKTPSYARVPIVMLTSMGSEGDVVRGFRLGADDYILKPFSPGELVARLRRLLRRQGEED